MRIEKIRFFHGDPRKPESRSEGERQRDELGREMLVWEGHWCLPFGWQEVSDERLAKRVLGEISLAPDQALVYNRALGVYQVAERKKLKTPKLPLRFWVERAKRGINNVRLFESETFSPDELNQTMNAEEARNYLLRRRWYLDPELLRSQDRIKEYDEIFRVPPLDECNNFIELFALLDVCGYIRSMTHGSLPVDGIKAAINEIRNTVLTMSKNGRTRQEAEREISKQIKKITRTGNLRDIVLRLVHQEMSTYSWETGG